MADRKSELRLNNLSFYYSSSDGFTVFGETFKAKPKYDVEKPIEFWRAQLAFRGCSPRGNDIEALKKRLRGANMNDLDDEVAQGAKELIAAHNARVGTSKKRKAGENEEEESRQKVKRALRPAEVAKKRINDRAMARPAGAARAKLLINERYKEALDKEAGGLRSSRPVHASGPIQSAIAPQIPPRKERVINRRTAGNDPDKFLQEAFFDDNGTDLAYPPVELKNLSSADRAHLHQACDDLNLFHETTVKSVMVIGSGKNSQGQQRLKELNRAAGWPPVPYVPTIDSEDENEDEEQESEDASEVEDEDESESSPAPEEEADQDWDITGSWEIKRPGMAGCFGPYAPYTLEVFSSNHRVGQQSYGRFELGQYNGVFRFSSQYKRRMGNRYEDDMEELLLPNNISSAESPTVFYRWRGRESGENVIELRSEVKLYEMTFSNRGDRVNGTWGCDGDSGTVPFSGVKVGSPIYGGINIQHEWGHLDEHTYKKENRDRWRRGY